MRSSSLNAPKSVPSEGSWASVVAVSLGAFVLVSSECAPIGLLSQVANDLKITEGEAGLLITFPGVMAAIAAPISISLFGKVNRRFILCGLLLALSLSNFVVAISTSIFPVLLARALLGVSLGGFWTIATSVGSRLRPSQQTLRATSIIYSGISMGTVAGVPASTLLGDWLGWRATFSLWGLFGFFALVGLVRTLPSLPPLPRLAVNGISSLIRLPKLRIGLVYIVLMLVAHFSAYTFVAPFLDESAAITGSLLSAFLLAYGIAGFAGNWLGGWYAGKNLTKAIAIAATGMTLSLALLMLSNSNGISLLGIVGWGMFFGALPITTQLYVFNAAPNQKENIAAISVSIGQVSIAVGAFTGGLAVDYYDVTGAILLGVALALALAAMAAYVAIREAQFATRMPSPEFPNG
jgi:predicted MFS family arabinose efflux permease